jgi:hypothetical protein
VINIIDEIDNKPISLNELAEQNAGKILPSGQIQDCVITIAGKLVNFSFKPLTKKIFVKGQATRDEVKFMDYVLTHSLWNRKKGETGDYWSLEELNKAIPDAWQVLLFSKIITESGFQFNKEDLVF